tara:strand:+ start:690 stop:881 length:192 start_codon:yes stop_codon:yes gene_type:complete
MRKGRKKQLQEEAIKRQSKYDKLTIKQKIKLAESRRGESKKELKQLRSDIDENHKNIKSTLQN